MNQAAGTDSKAAAALTVSSANAKNHQREGNTLSTYPVPGAALSVISFNPRSNLTREALPHLLYGRGHGHSDSVTCQRLFSPPLRGVGSSPRHTGPLAVCLPRGARPSHALTGLCAYPVSQAQALAGCSAQSCIPPGPSPNLALFSAYPPRIWAPWGHHTPSLPRGDPTQISSGKTLALCWPPKRMRSKGDKKADSPTWNALLPTPPISHG